MERLEHKIFRKSTFTNITGSIKFFLYTYFVSGFLDLLNLKQILILFGTNSILTVISQFFISPRAVKKITWKLSEGLQKLEQENFTEKENTELLIELNKIPKIITTGVAGNVSVVTVLVAGLAFWFSNPSIHVIVVAVTCCVLCIYSFAAKTYNETETIICKECNTGNNSENKTADAGCGISHKQTVVLFIKETGQSESTEGQNIITDHLNDR